MTRKMINKYTASKINVTPKGVCLLISKLHSIYLSVANLLAHNNKFVTAVKSAAINCSFSYNLTPLGVTFILLVKVAT